MRKKGMLGKEDNKLGAKPWKNNSRCLNEYLRIKSIFKVLHKLYSLVKIGWVLKNRVLMSSLEQF